MLFNSVLAVAGVALTALPQASANGISLKIGQYKNWSAGSGNGCNFWANLKGRKTCCDSGKRKPVPSHENCPFGWEWSDVQNCCAPVQQESKCDCGEGYTFNEDLFKCVKNQGNCGSGKWWHDRTGECCDDAWEWNPPQDNCPPGISCPTDWFWHKGHQQCRPKRKRSREPDCGDWDDKNKCCGSHGPKPTNKWGDKDKGNKRPGKGGNRWKRNQVTLEDDIDHTMYCPGDMMACSIPSASTWSFECIDPATELESCGGCAYKADGSPSVGVDCTQIPNVLATGVECQSGVCVVHKCKPGFKVVNGACQGR